MNRKSPLLRQTYSSLWQRDVCLSTPCCNNMALGTEDIHSPIPHSDLSLTQLQPACPWGTQCLAVSMYWTFSKCSFRVINLVILPITRLVTVGVNVPCGAAAVDRYVCSLFLTDRDDRKGGTSNRTCSQTVITFPLSYLSLDMYHLYGIPWIKEVYCLTKSLTTVVRCVNVLPLVESVTTPGL